MTRTLSKTSTLLSDQPKLVIAGVHFHFCYFFSTAFLALAFFGNFSGVAIANDNPAIAKLKEIQAKVTSVVSKNLDACVVVNDGVGSGSGAIINESGLVLTAGHVMSAPGPYTIVLPSGRTVKAKALGKNLNDDTGMVQIMEPGPWPFVKMDPNPDFKTGQWVVSLGHSGGFELGRNPPVRTGRILGTKGGQLLTDAVLIGGDSGGPLFNLEGELIGIHSSIGDNISENRHAMTSSFVRDWDRLKRGDTWGKLPDLNDPDVKKRKGLLGIKVDLEASHCRIKSVDVGMPAHDIGLEANDIVKVFDNVVITDGRHLIDVVKRKFAGDVCPIVIERGGKKFEFEILLR